MYILSYLYFICSRLSLLYKLTKLREVQGCITRSSFGIHIIDCILTEIVIMLHLTRRLVYSTVVLKCVYVMLYKYE